jgi:hypothetical protein
VYACMNVCMINSIRTRSRRVISCNNTSRRAHMNLLHEPTDDDDDDNNKVLLRSRKRKREEQVRKKQKLSNDSGKRAK